MWHTHAGMGWWMLFGGGLWMLLIFVGIFFVLTLARPTVKETDRREPGPSDQAVEIARQRYARGEIDREEFEQIRRDLDASNTPDWTSTPA